MYFTSAKSQRELGYAARPATDALTDAICWFRQIGYLDR
jgi:dihydroflavonol-4-reductase